jgi:hypothetical protein
MSKDSDTGLPLEIQVSESLVPETWGYSGFHYRLVLGLIGFHMSKDSDPGLPLDSIMLLSDIVNFFCDNFAPWLIDE